MMGTAKYKFSGHQTFVFRYGWLEKGVRGVAAQPDLFSREDALVTLGVGKNMVDSIRHWCQLAQLVEQDDCRERLNARFLRPTEIATKLLLDGGWDPYVPFCDWTEAIIAGACLCLCARSVFRFIPSWATDHDGAGLPVWSRQPWAGIQAR